MEKGRTEQQFCRNLHRGPEVYTARIHSRARASLPLITRCWQLRSELQITNVCHLVTRKHLPLPGSPSAEGTSITIRSVFAGAAVTGHCPEGPRSLPAHLLAWSALWWETQGMSKPRVVKKKKAVFIGMSGVLCTAPKIPISEALHFIGFLNKEMVSSYIRF